MKKFVSALLVAGLSASILAACGSGGSGETAEGTGAEGAAPEEETITLRMIESLTSPARTEILAAMIDRFEEANPNIQVELISPPFEQADNKIRMMLSAKEELDVLEVRDLNVAEMVNNGYIEPLNQYTSQWADFATLGSVPKSVGSIGEELYFVPNGLYQRQMFYRKDWFDEKGLQPPKTWDELYEVGKQLTDPAVNRYGFSFRGGPGANSNTDAMVLSFNGDNVNLEDSMFTNDGATIFSTPEAKSALELYLKIYNDISPKDSINWGFQEQVQAFTSGVTAMLLQDPDVIQTVTESLPEGTWATAPMPTGPDGKALIAAGGAGWGIAQHSENKEAAWKLIEFLSSPEENTGFSKDFGLVPVHTTATEDEFFQTGPYRTLIDMSNDPNTFVNYKPPFAYPGTGQWGNVAMETGQALLLGEATVDETLAVWDAYWKKEKEALASK